MPHLGWNEELRRAPLPVFISRGVYTDVGLALERAPEPRRQEDPLGDFSDGACVVRRLGTTAAHDECLRLERCRCGGCFCEDEKNVKMLVCAGCERHGRRGKTRRRARVRDKMRVVELARATGEHREKERARWRMRWGGGEGE